VKGFRTPTCILKAGLNSQNTSFNVLVDKTIQVSHKYLNQINEKDTDELLTITTGYKQKRLSN